MEDHPFVDVLDPAPDHSTLNHPNPNDHPSHTNTPLPHPDTPPHDPERDSPPPPKPKNKGGRPRKERVPIIRGSAQDFRRREANRLAAERSRSRQAERVIALEKARESLSEENVRLKAELTRFEEGEGGREVGGGGGGNGIGVGVGGLENGGGNNASAEASDSHSRTILAALMGGNVEDAFGVNVGDAASWIQGVENMLKEAESSGRLGELAEVAAGQGEGEAEGEVEGGEGNEMQGEVVLDEGGGVSVGVGGEMNMVGGSQASRSAGNAPHQENPQTQTLDVLDQDPTQPPEPDDDPPRQNPTAGFDKPTFALETASAMAVALNAELEKILREDLALTKAALVRTERQLSRLKTGPLLGDAHEPEMITEESPVLPSTITSDNFDDLHNQIEQMSIEIKNLEDDLPARRQLLLQLRVVKIEREAKLIVKSGELYELNEEGGVGMESVMEEKGKTEYLLKSVGTFLSSLIGGWHVDDPSLANINILGKPYSSPAIARRRRGRPPKASLLKPLTPSQAVPPPRNSTKRTLAEVEIDSSDIDRAPKSRYQGKTRLAEQVFPDPDQEVGVAGEGEGVDGAVGGGGEDENDDVDVTGLQGEDTQEGDVETDAATAEQYILSHLANAGVGVEDVDASSFAEFMPDGTMLGDGKEDEVQEEQVGAEGNASGSGSVNSISGVIGVAGADPVIPKGSSMILGPSGQPSVLSRLRRGAPGSCDICGRTETSVWRKLTLGNEDHKVCNACGLYHTKFGVIRPPELWGDGKGVKKRRATTRQSMGEGGKKKGKKSGEGEGGGVGEGEGKDGEGQDGEGQGEGEEGTLADVAGEDVDVGGFEGLGDVGILDMQGGEGEQVAMGGEGEDGEEGAGIGAGGDTSMANIFAV